MKSTLSPPSTALGVTPKLSILGSTPTLTVFSTVPASFDAVSVYRVAKEGVTLMLASAMTAPKPGSRVTSSAPTTSHVKVDEVPGETDVGDAVKDVITGISRPTPVVPEVPDAVPEEPAAPDVARELLALVPEPPLDADVPLLDTEISVLDELVELVPEEPVVMLELPPEELAVPELVDESLP